MEASASNPQQEVKIEQDDEGVYGTDPDTTESDHTEQPMDDLHDDMDRRQMQSEGNDPVIKQEIENPEGDEEQDDADAAQSLPDEQHDPPIVNLMPDPVAGDNDDDGDIVFLSVAKAVYADRAAITQKSLGWLFQMHVGQSLALPRRYIARAWHLRADQVALRDEHDSELPDGPVQDSMVLSARAIRRDVRGPSRRTSGQPSGASSSSSHGPPGLPLPPPLSPSADQAERPRTVSTTVPWRSQAVAPWRQEAAASEPHERLVRTPLRPHRQRAQQPYQPHPQGRGSVELALGTWSVSPPPGQPQSWQAPIEMGQFCVSLDDHVTVESLSRVFGPALHVLRAGERVHNGAILPDDRLILRQNMRILAAQAQLHFPAELHHEFQGGAAPSPLCTMQSSHEACLLCGGGEALEPGFAKRYNQCVQLLRRRAHYGWSDSQIRALLRAEPRLVDQVLKDSPEHKQNIAAAAKKLGMTAVLTMGTKRAASMPPVQREGGAARGVAFDAPATTSTTTTMSSATRGGAQRRSQSARPSSTGDRKRDNGKGNGVSAATTSTTATSRSKGKGKNQSLDGSGSVKAATVTKGSGKKGAGSKGDPRSRTSTATVQWKLTGMWSVPVYQDWKRNVAGVFMTESEDQLRQWATESFNTQVPVAAVAPMRLRDVGFVEPQEMTIDVIKITGWGGAATAP